MAKLFQFGQFYQYQQFNTRRFSVVIHLRHFFLYRNNTQIRKFAELTSKHNVKLIKCKPNK